jgi:hypothetical protein
MLSDKGISNKSIGVITQLLQGGDVEAAFPTTDGIQVISSYSTSGYTVVSSYRLYPNF